RRTAMRGPNAWTAFLSGLIPLIALPAAGEDPKPVASAGALSGLPFSAGMESGDFVYLSGALGNKPGVRAVEAGAAAQPRQALDNLEAVLKAAGLSLGNAVETRVFLPDLRRLDEVEKVLAERFPSRPPARTVVQGELALAGAEVEITLIAARKGVE